MVRGYGRVEYDWGPAVGASTAVQIKSIRLTTDCPTCGVMVQEHRPAEDEEFGGEL